MIIPHLKQQEFIDHLIKNKCKIVSNDDWEDHDRIMIQFGDITFPLQMQSAYYYYTVNKICEDLGIPSDEFCLKVKEQLNSRKKEN